MDLYSYSHLGVHVRLGDTVLDARQCSERMNELERELDKIRSVIKDPSAVWINMLRGEIARPSALDHYEECKAMTERLERELAAVTKERDELIEQLRQIFST